MGGEENEMDEGQTSGEGGQAEYGEKMFLTSEDDPNIPAGVTVVHPSVSQAMVQARMLRNAGIADVVDLKSMLKRFESVMTWDEATIKMINKLIRVLQADDSGAAMGGKLNAMIKLITVLQEDESRAGMGGKLNTMIIKAGKRAEKMVKLNPVLHRINATQIFQLPANQDGSPTTSLGFVGQYGDILGPLTDQIRITAAQYATGLEEGDIIIQKFIRIQRRFAPRLLQLWRLILGGNLDFLIHDDDTPRDNGDMFFFPDLVLSLLLELEGLLSCWNGLVNAIGEEGKVEYKHTSYFTLMANAGKAVCVGLDNLTDLKRLYTAKLAVGPAAMPHPA